MQERSYQDDLGLLSVERLNGISRYLWLAGRPYKDPMEKNALHRLKAGGLDPVVFENAGLHLLWHDTTIYVKPLPDFLMDYDFWQHLYSSTDEKDGVQVEIIEGALGLLLSYTWLIRWKSDLKLARELGLLDASIDLETWRAFTASFLSTFERRQIQKPLLSWRYDFGDLRLKRINAIWRLRPRSPVDVTSLLLGYHAQYRRYTPFFQSTFGLVLVAFIYATVVLTAMQVGLATDRLAGDTRFQDASEGFAIFCIMLPVVALGLAALLFSFLFCYHLIATRQNLHRTLQKRRLDS
ncbi:MAG: hypothetical protein M1818_000009 [Claussenomyces sp. TS43310]|nr:MAG: hypothetical protein M1818_000009 [Claussenomyces sp. TS43310]